MDEGECEMVPTAADDTVVAAAAGRKAWDEWSVPWGQWLVLVEQAA